VDASARSQRAVMQTAGVGFSRGPAAVRVPPAGPLLALLVMVLLVVLAGCGSSGAGRPGPSSSTAGAGVPTTVPPTSPSTSPAPTALTTASLGPPLGPTTGPGLTPTSSGPAAPTPENNGATPAPSWLGTRVLPKGSDGFGVVRPTPPELRDRRIITTDRLPPPPDGRFRSRIVAVPADVARRSTWSARCPVALHDLRYVTVSFLGFDGRGHTGELLVNRTVAAQVVTVFQQLYTVGWPIEEMRVTSLAELNARPTGDGNNTSAFVCRPVRGSTTWSQHAYGLAIDLNPFHNPYVKGRTVLPELASYYTDRSRRLAGMNLPGSPPVVAFQSIGWGWGGSFSSKKDWMHFSSNGR
jgi:hypothetical protein